MALASRRPSGHATPVTDQNPFEAAGLPARAVGVDLLEAALSRRGGLEAELGAPGLAGLAPRDRAFARALVMATLRHLGPIDAALQARLERLPPERVVQILRLGAAQLFALKAAPHAAVSTSVELAAADKRSRPFKGLVNAVLRGLLREPPALDDPDVLAPPWLLARWRAAYGAEAARAIAAIIADEPATDLSLRDPGEAATLAAALEGEILPGGSVRTALRGDVSAWPGFAEGRWWVQDAAAAVPARLTGAGPGVRVLDMCAAPGGKTLQLAAAGAEVTALDRSAPRLKRLSENLARTGLAAEIVTADAAEWRGAAPFDAVLLDAPCSSTGTFRRHPDVLWASRPGDIASLAAVQARLLDAAAAQVKPQGRLIYCVCSLEPEEGEAQAAGFLRRRPEFALEPAAAGEGGAPEASRAGDGALRILPHHRPGGLDGFYVARFRRNG
jgi:16S rRNA (cytosine967-C5)-methyltransferase